MIKLQELVGVPSLEYHINEGLTLYDNVYRYSSTSFIQLFKEAREQWRDNKIQLNEEDLYLIEHTDIGEYGDYNGERVPLDLPMVYEFRNLVYKGRKFSHEEEDRLDLIAHRKFNCDFEDCTDDQKDEVLKDKEQVGVKEAEYRGRDVDLNKPKRSSGPKKFYVYVKNKNGNVVKVNFGDSGNLSVKIDEPGARASFAARHKCAQKKDKTTPGYWSCNIGRYWKSLGGKRNFSGYW